jgi:hypothetical protein
MVGKMGFWRENAHRPSHWRGSSWLVSPHSHQLGARLPWEGSWQATTYARSNFELPCGELLVEGGPFSLAVSITVLPLLLRMVRSSAPFSMNCGMASLSTVVKVGVSPSFLRGFAPSFNNSSSKSVRKVSCSDSPRYRVHLHLLRLERADAHTPRCRHFPFGTLRYMEGMGWGGGCDEIPLVLFLALSIPATVRSGSPFCSHSHLLSLPDVETSWPQ